MVIKKLSFAFVLGLAVLTACKDEPMLALEEQQNVEDQQSIDASHSDGMMVLGQELQDPYKLSNMQQAYANITGAKAQLQPTHRYMRFLPKNEEELYLLKNIDLFNFPLHYEISQNGDYYHDPELPADAITWQYAVIPIDTRIPENIQHELIYEVFIPNYDTDGSKSGLLEVIEDEAIRLCGYSDKLQQNASKGLFSNNQREIHSNTLLPIDNVSGYTLSQIEDVIKQSYKQFFQFSPIDPLGITDPVGLVFNTNSLKIIRGNLKSMYKNPTSEYLDELFDNYMK